LIINILSKIKAKTVFKTIVFKYFKYLYNKRAYPTKKEPQQGFLYLYNKRACPTKNEPQQGISSLEREREGGERERWEGVRERGV
jgi:hypothetical protein